MEDIQSYARYSIIWMELCESLSFFLIFSDHVFLLEVVWFF